MRADADVLMDGPLVVGSWDLGAATPNRGAMVGNSSTATHGPRSQPGWRRVGIALLSG